MSSKVNAKMGKELYRVGMKIGKHSLIADEPEEFGGMNLGPTPYDFLNMALASCTAMTIRMWADKYHIAVDTIDVEVSHDRIYAKDCEICDKEKGQIDVLYRKIIITGDISDEDKERILKIADRCPVHRTLTNEILIKTSY